MPKKTIPITVHLTEGENNKLKAMIAASPIKVSRQDLVVSAIRRAAAIAVGEEKVDIFSIINDHLESVSKINQRRMRGLGYGSSRVPEQD